MKAQEENWLPLESNPAVMNDFLKQLGFNADKYSVHQMFSIQQWAQGMLPKPIFGVVFLYQINKAQKQYAKIESQTLDPSKVSQNIFFMKQLAKNACGTIALLHVLLNQIQRYPDLFQENSYLSNFLIQNLEKNPQQRGENFQNSKGIKQQHKKSVKKGDTQVREKVQTHFIAFIQKDGFLYELDGGKKMPVNHGQCTPEGLVTMASLVIQQFMNRDPTNIQFTLLALGAKQ